MQILTRNGKEANNSWTEVTPESPCEACGKPDWCARNGSAFVCRRESVHPTRGPGREKQDESGASYWCWSDRPTHPPVTHPPTGSETLADADTLHRVYSALLGKLALRLHHAEHLQARGFDTDLLRQAQNVWQYRTLPGKGRPGIVAQLIADGLEPLLASVPGFVVREHDGQRYWTISGKAGIVIPVRDHEGRIVGLKIRADATGTGSRYRWMTSKPDGGVGPGSPLHYPLFEGDRSTVRITEGELKADVATFRTGIQTIALPGVGSWKRAAKACEGATTAIVAFDADARHNPAVAESLESIVSDLRDKSFRVELDTWEAEYGKGIDDVLLKGHELQRLDTIEDVAGFVHETSASAGKATEEEVGDRLVIEVTPDEFRVNAEALAALRREQDVYQRGGRLVQIVETENGPAIRDLPESILREMLSEQVYFWAEKITKNGIINVQVGPPRFTVEAIRNRGEWSGIRHLAGVVTSPVLRADGTILDQPGYDPESRLFFKPSGPVPEIPANPSKDDAIDAAAELDLVVSDFPFQSPEHQAAFLAALLTPLAREMFSTSPSPLFLIDANTRGTGKGLLADVIGLIVSGERLPTQAALRKDEEFEKRVTAIAERGDRMILLDNIAFAIGGPTIDSLLTSTRWQGRRLGSTEMMDFPLRTTWYATGNNCELKADTARRVCHIRMQSPHERPEEREDFQFSDLRGYVRANRDKLLAAALTILRAFVVAGRPDQGLKSWGSFEGWSSVVRNAIAWIGKPDPGLTRQELVETADRSMGQLSGLITGWQEIDPEGHGLTTAEVVRQLEATPDGYDSLREAIQDAIGDDRKKPVSSRALGQILRKFRGRVVSGHYMDSQKIRGNRLQWRVVNTAGG